MTVLQKPAGQNCYYPPASQGPKRRLEAGQLAPIFFCAGCEMPHGLRSGEEIERGMCDIYQNRLERRLQKSRRRGQMEIKRRKVAVARSHFDLFGLWERD